MTIIMNLTIPGMTDKIASPDGFKLESKGLGEVVMAFVPILMGIVGIILFLMLVFGGFTMLTAVGDPEGVKKGQALITNAIIGFVIIFVAFWIMQLLQVMFGLGLGFGMGN